VLLLLPITPTSKVSAAGILTLYPDEGRVSDQLNIEGSGFAADQIVRLYFSSNRADRGDSINIQVTAYQLLGTTLTNSVGNFGSRLAFLVPVALNSGTDSKVVDSGEYYVYATYTNSQRIQSVARFYVIGPVTASPNKAKIGEWVRLEATGLNADQMISLFFSSKKADIGDYIDNEVGAYKYLGTIHIKADGGFEPLVGFQIPTRLTDGKFQEDVHSGDYYFYGSYYSSNKRINTATLFIVLDGTIQLNPSEGAVDTQVEIKGQGLRSDQRIRVKYDEKPIDIASGATKTDGSGSFTCTVIVPDSSAGTHTVVVTDETGNQPQVYFDVKPKVTLTPSSVIMGKAVEIRGTGFGETEDISVTFNGKRVPTTPLIIRTNYNGSFTASFAASNEAGTGTVTLEVSDSSFNKTSTQFTILPITTIQAAITLNPATTSASPGYVGIQITVEGTKFAANSEVTLVYSGAGSMPIARANTDNKGDFLTTFTAPPSTGGDHSVTATDGANTASAIFFMELKSPAVPILLSPKSGSAVGAAAYFDWSDVTDESGLTYTLQVATDASFNSVILEKENLTQSEYTLGQAEELAPSGRQLQHSWRVKAIDGAFNESEWTAPVMFYIGSSPALLSGWLMFTLIGIAVLVLGFLAFRIRKVFMPR
jgi:hypothetical protein